MPSAIKHDHELAAKGLVSILVEAQGADEPTLEGFLWKTFPDNECFASVGTFVPIPASSSIPNAAVIGVDGTLLWTGNPLSDPKKIEELIDGELAKVKKGWGDTADARKMRAALYGRGDLAGALAAIALLPEGEPKTTLQAEIDSRYATMKKAIETQKERGNWLEAQAQAKSLQKGVGANAAWAAEVAPIVADFDSESGKAELALERKFEKVEKQLREKKGDTAPKLLKAMLKDGSISKVAARIQRTLTALETPLK